MGLVLLVVGSNFAVIYAEKFALSIGISEVIVGLTILALGTSLPELAATVSAILKGKNQMVIGNITMQLNVVHIHDWNIHIQNVMMGMVD